MTFGSTKSGKLHNVVVHIILAIKKTESFVFAGYAHLQCLISCFPAFEEALEVISSVLLIR